MNETPEQSERAAGFRRNMKLEGLLQELNAVLRCAEDRLQDADVTVRDDHPVIFIMGPLRSGTTLFMQWLASTGIAAYPTNLLSRFYGVPVVGARIQQLLTDPDYNFRDELTGFNESIRFDSENGKTRGVLAPNEFWYFWRRFLPFRDLDWLSDEELMSAADHRKLVAELSGLTRVFGKPFALKAMILNYNIHFLDSIFRKALFIQIRRDPVANVASVLDARRRQYGNTETWYSFKIPEYPQLKGLDPVRQSAGQVYYINRAVSAGMSKVAPDRRLEVQYEDFCHNPRACYEQLMARLHPQATGGYTGPAQFSLTRDTDIPDRVAIEEALSAYKSQA